MFDHTITPEMLDTDLNAKFYESMKHDPFNIEVMNSYRHFKNELAHQFRALVADRWEFFPFDDVDKGYADSKAMFSVADTKTLFYLPTEFTPLSADHPMNRLSPFDGFLWNDVFRIVHDINGHYKARSGFGPQGEFIAWLTHRATFDKESLDALWCETRGQNTWTNQSAHFYLPMNERPYAEQKAGIVPWTLK